MIIFDDKESTLMALALRGGFTLDIDKLKIQPAARAMLWAITKPRAKGKFSKKDLNLATLLKKSFD